MTIQIINEKKRTIIHFTFTDRRSIDAIISVLEDFRKDHFDERSKPAETAGKSPEHPKSSTEELPARESESKPKPI